MKRRPDVTDYKAMDEPTPRRGEIPDPADTNYPGAERPVNDGGGNAPQPEPEPDEGAAEPPSDSNVPY